MRKRSLTERISRVLLSEASRAEWDARIKRIPISPEIQNWLKNQMGNTSLLKFEERDVQERIDDFNQTFRRTEGVRGLDLSCYGYYPKNSEMTEWVATDGSTVTVATVGDLILGYGGNGIFEDFMSMDALDFLSQYGIAGRNKGQEDYEFRKL